MFGSSLEWRSAHVSLQVTFRGTCRSVRNLRRAAGHLSAVQVGGTARCIASQVVHPSEMSRCADCGGRPCFGAPPRQLRPGARLSGLAPVHRSNQQYTLFHRRSTKDPSPFGRVLGFSRNFVHVFRFDETVACTEVNSSDLPSCESELSGRPSGRELRHADRRAAQLGWGRALLLLTTAATIFRPRSSARTFGSGRTGNHSPQTVSTRIARVRP